MKINHCNNDFKSYDVWFLYDNATDKNRRLLLGKCPVCKKDVVCLVETRKSDGRIFAQKETGEKAGKLIDDAIRKKDVDYCESELKIRQGNGAPLGLCYGDNKEIKNNKGEVIKIRVKRCDWYGQKEIIKEEYGSRCGSGCPPRKWRGMAQARNTTEYGSRCGSTTAYGSRCGSTTTGKVVS